jgi:hypothetical protein
MGGFTGFNNIGFGLNKDKSANVTVREMEKALASVITSMNNWGNTFLHFLNHLNVTELYTEYCDIKSEDGETQIDGPLILMYDKQGTPVLRLKEGYDPVSDDFVFQLYNAAGNLTVNIDSNGDLSVERGTFKGSITIGTGNNVFKADGANGIWLGHDTFASAPFKVSLAGALTASNVTVTGGTITIGTGNNVFKVDNNGMYLGNATFASAPFKVSMAGAATASNMNITGGTITIGTGDEVFVVDMTTGFHMGDATFADAPFRVTKAGVVTIEGEDSSLSIGTTTARVLINTLDTYGGAITWYGLYGGSEELLGQIKWDTDATTWLLSSINALTVYADGLLSISTLGEGTGGDIVLNPNTGKAAYYHIGTGDPVAGEELVTQDDVIDYVDSWFTGNFTGSFATGDGRTANVYKGLITSVA